MRPVELVAQPKLAVSIWLTQVGAMLSVLGSGTFQQLLA